MIVVQKITVEKNHPQRVVFNMIVVQKKVREIIKQIETINRDEKEGNISSSEANKKITSISNNFLRDFGFWPYVTKSFELFYKSFEK